jgi:hypothetical protein
LPFKPTIRRLDAGTPGAPLFELFGSLIGATSRKKRFFGVEFEFGLAPVLEGGTFFFFGAFARIFAIWGKR